MPDKVNFDEAFGEDVEEIAEDSDEKEDPGEKSSDDTFLSPPGLREAKQSQPAPKIITDKSKPIDLDDPENVTVGQPVPDQSPVVDLD